MTEVQMLMTMTVDGPFSWPPKDAAAAMQRPLVSPAATRPALAGRAELIALIQQHEGTPEPNPPLLFKATVTVGFGVVAFTILGVVHLLASAAIHSF
jgi:hypothetical protein